MRRRRTALVLLCVSGIAFAVLGGWYALRPNVATPLIEPADPSKAHNREATEKMLEACLGLTAREVVQRLKLDDAKWSWTNEPPGILRGVSYYTKEKRSIHLYTAQGEPQFRKFSEEMSWDYELFLGSKIGGIQYDFAGDNQIDIGPAVPWQWRSPNPN